MQRPLLLDRVRRFRAGSLPTGLVSPYLERTKVQSIEAPVSQGPPATLLHIYVSGKFGLRVEEILPFCLHCTIYSLSLPGTLDSLAPIAMESLTAPSDHRQPEWQLFL